MKKFILILIVFLLTSGLCFATTYVDCRKLYDSGLFDKASSCYYSLMVKDNSNPALRYGYANSLFQQKRFNEAKVQYTQIIQRYPNSKVATASKKHLELTNQMLQTIKTSRSNDSGDYLSQTSYGKWKKMPLKVWIESGKYAASAKSAFLEWQNKTRGTVSFIFVKTPEDAQIKVYFKDNIAKAKEGDALGVTKSWGLNNGELKSADIDVKKVNKTGLALSPSQVYAVTLHEVGHAIGILGHSDNKYDVMYPSDDNYRNSLSNRDINTVKAIYK